MDHNPHFLIVASGYNYSQCAEACVNSINAQTYKKFTVLFIDDCSSDLGYKAFEKLNGAYNYHQLYMMPENRGTVYCRNWAIKQFTGEYDVIVWLDLDDELLPNSLERLAKEYKEKQCWLTYGNYIDSKGRVFDNEYTDLIKTHNAYRQVPFKFVHLRSFRKELYFKLMHEDLFPSYLGPNGENAYPDMNMLLCLLEMCPPEKVSYISDVLYKYKDDYPMSAINRFRDRRQKEIEAVMKITPKQTIWSLNS